MPQYKIPATWSVSATFDVEADCLQEAIEKVETGEEPARLPRGSYIDDSFEIDDDVLQEFHPNLAG